MKIVVLAGGISTERAVSLVTGTGVCRALRDQGSSVPVIILTAREEEADKVLGLEIGVRRQQGVCVLLHCGPQ